MALLTAVSRFVAPREPVTGSEIADAREALEYWTRREERLPWHRRAARREARRMAASWRQVLVGAHLQRARLSRFEHAVVPLFDTGGRTAGQLAWRWLRRSAVGRVLLVVAVGWIATAAVVLALLTVLAMHVLGS